MSARIRRLSVVSVLGALSCGAGYAPDYVSKAGVSYELTYRDPTNTWTPEQIEAQESDFLARTADLGPGVLKAMRSTGVVVFASKFECGTASANGLCHGTADGPVLSIQNMGCPGNSALAHELLHRALGSVRGFPDPLHADPLWTTVDVAGVCP